LSATLLNNLAAAFMVAGFVAPATSGRLDSTDRIAMALIWIGIGFALHRLAIALLGGLKE
jgi:hypothetical protein